MKTLIATTALALTLAAPALANEQLANALGVDAGDYTTSELVRLQAAYDADDRDTVRFILSGEAANAAPVPAATDFAVAAAEQDDNRILAGFLRSEGSEVVSTQGNGATDAARAFAIQVAEQNDDQVRADYLRNGGSLTTY
ncbi:hypothetical protein HKCCE3408_03180 [Rhodobacterales bacterium HKCCE3408]|nr:hypothetical protein [Rhodobacterales bacterium HKCCE3408]